MSANISANLPPTMYHGTSAFLGSSPTEMPGSPGVNAFANYRSDADLRAKRATATETTETTKTIAGVPIRMEEFSSKVQKQLDRIIDKVKGMNVKIEITGHTPSFLDYGIRRADAVKEYFVSKGIEANLIATYGQGDLPADTPKGAVFITWRPRQETGAAAARTYRDKPGTLDDSSRSEMSKTTNGAAEAHQSNIRDRTDRIKCTKLADNVMICSPEASTETV